MQANHTWILNKLSANSVKSVAFQLLSPAITPTTTPHKGPVAAAAQIHPAYTTHKRKNYTLLQTQETHDKDLETLMTLTKDHRLPNFLHTHTAFT